MTDHEWLAVMLVYTRLCTHVIHMCTSSFMQSHLNMMQGT